MTEADPSRARADASPSGCPGLDSSLEWDDASLLRGDILSSDRLKEHAQELARAHGETSLRIPAGRLSARISAARDRILHAYAMLAQHPRATRNSSPAEEWLLDNSYIVSEQLHEIDEDLPWGYLVKLPRLTVGKMRGYPRVYGLCLDYLRHTDARIDPDTLAEYVASYQTVSPLAIGELWAVPILLRLGLILTTGALASTEADVLLRARSEKVADRLSIPPGPGMPEPPWDSEPPRSGEQQLRREHARQAADQVLIGNAITSMRTIAALEWRKFFERTSLVESILRQDPASVYAATDEASRDRYRHAIEILAERSRSDERKVAMAALELSREAERNTPGSPWARHVGHYLVDSGRRRLETLLGYRPTLRERVVRAILDHPGVFYFGTLVVVFCGLLGAWATEFTRYSLEPGISVVLLLLAALPMSEMAIAFVNAMTVTALPPRVLARLSFRDGVPAEHRTLVVVPALVDSEESLKQLLSHLEVRALANADENVHFALLSDLPDSDVLEGPGDAELVLAAKNGIEELNRRSSGLGTARFFLFHRSRLWNEKEGVFMGWERKRGKLEELNRLLSQRGETSFSIVTAPVEVLRSVRYVITLDADTDLPRNAALELIGTMAHPLNRPRWSAVGQLVGGYGVIQPRIGTLPGSSRRSRFARITAGPSGIDPYTTAISDVYQDLFGSGSYVGKAIYDVDTFLRGLEGRVPENRLLSHDLFEGIFARTALASDIELLDDQPSSYAVVAARQHRWIRGDFQLAPWLLPRVPAQRGGTRPTDLPALGWWKLFDNLRRALVAPAVIAASLVGWMSGRALAPLMTVTVVLCLTAPLYGRLTTALFRTPRRGAPSFRPIVGELWISIGQIFLNAVFLLDQATIAVDAMLRTAYRLLVSKKNLLEWQTAGQAERSYAGRLPLRLWMTAAFALVNVGMIFFVSPGALPFSAPILLLWASAPGWALFLARPGTRRRAAPLSESDARLLRAMARKTWRFFETFVTEEDHFLPPDNYQEDPLGVIAHRTSPTNIGCYLMSIVAARDFGFITLAEVLERANATLTTMERLERREGHILNWYDTTTLKSLDPPYVSTVDSGNLAAYLWTIREACAELVRAPILSEHVIGAALDALRLSQVGSEDRRFPPAEAALEKRFVEACKTTQQRPFVRLGELDEFAHALGRLGAEPSKAEGDAAYWLERAGVGLSRAATELRALAPWIERLAEAPAELSTGAVGPLWEKLESSMASADSLSGVVACAGRTVQLLDELDDSLDRATELSDPGRLRTRRYLAELRAEISSSAATCKSTGDALVALGERAGALADAMNFAFLYDEDRLLFSIGYNAQAERLDGSHYDLLASEARLASFVAIAKGDVRQEHWFRLHRSLAAPAGSRALWSWSGSMFEYLMPLLVMKDGDGTLLHETYVSVVDAQRRYGQDHGTPWGISESLFNIMDLSMTYQYRAFGVPGLGLRKGLEEDLVVAPYATALAALVRPDLAIENIRVLEQEGLDGRYGYYEAIDYTPARRPPGKRGVVVKAFMAHHQGMTLVALDNVLGGGRMQRRFHADPRVQATELLLEERVPVTEPTTVLRPTVAPVLAGDEPEPEVADRVLLDTKAWPRAHLLGHGDVSTIITNVGTGVTMWRGLDASRFREDSTLPSGGVFVYVRDQKTGRTWSIGYEPTRTMPDAYEAVFSADRVEIRRRDGDIETVLEVVVSPESPAEVRRITLTNHGALRRELEVTTYTEVVLAPRNADRAHRAFSGMFVETEAIADRGALVAWRRPHATGDVEAWIVQVLTPEEGSWSEFDYDCSRELFIGRGRDVDKPAALDRGARLSRSVGAVLDPAFALRRSISIKSGKSARVALTTALATDRSSAGRLIEQYSDPHSVPRTFELGRADARFELRHLGVSPAEGMVFQRLLSALVFPHPRLRAGGSLEVEGARGRNALWAQGISGDLPILVLRLDDTDFADLAAALLSAHELFRLNGFPIDLVLLDEEPGGYFHPLQDQALELVRTSVARGSIDRSGGGVFIRRADQMPEADRALLLRAAHVVLSSSKGSLSRQVRRGTHGLPVPARSPKLRRAPPEAPVARPRPALDFDNGIGGFDARTGEYVMIVGRGKRPSAPWCNVIATPNFGFVVSEGGATNTWSKNSQGHRLTPWSNDPVCDPSGEILYVCDDEDGSVWSPTPDPAGGAAEYTVRHGFGYTTFEHDRGDVHHVLSVFADRERPAKIFRLRLTNHGASARKFRVYGVVDWVLGSVRERSFLTVATGWERACSAIFANNPFSTHPDRCAFFSSTSPPASFTADRGEFFGQSGSRARPAAVDRVGLSGRTGAGLDACAALEVPVRLPPGESVDIVFVLGDGATRAEAQEVATQFLEPGAVERSFEDAKTFWRQLLAKVTVRTPDLALDRLLNGWLLYQTMSCRLFGRSAFYQSGGAYGFRDQLQDVMAVLHAAPAMAREHLLRAAARQFIEGDVQHWWHPDTGEGVRTRCSDDMLWLPYVAAEYVRATGDVAVLDDVVPFLDDKPIPDADSEVLGKPSVSTESASLYEHCIRAIDVGTTAGPHGLPLMRGGDWNDGMNRVGGEGGRGGESVWLAWFLAKTLTTWSSLAAGRGDGARQQRFLAEVLRLSGAIEESAWDGAWYRRGYFEDGTPFGSAQNQDCRIDAIAQSWATISGAASPARAALALDQSEALLVRERERMMSLLWPPFRSSEHDPGYIRAYPPGVRENGGQYTHGVLWTVLARTLAGQGDHAFALFSMLNPIHHGTSVSSATAYAVEPYVVAADVSAASDHRGRGGWTWYTGAAGWMYRIGLESILGVRLDGGDLVISPCVPARFSRYEVDYMHGSSVYRIVVENPGRVSSGVVGLDIDGKSVTTALGPRIHLVDDGQVHEVRVVLGSGASAHTGDDGGGAASAAAHLSGASSTGQ